jgi:hypothetical protein
MSAPVVLDILQGDDFEKFPSGSYRNTPVVNDSSLAIRIAGTSDSGLGIPSVLHAEIASLLIARRKVER